MNEHVKQSLKLYLEDTDPQYAILIKGDWGCGKTHFIKEWIKDQNQDNASAYDVVYVSLFGLSTIKGLVD
jgi:tRNA A37 threonylcarbamoyladenosine biosynthesis protein TsaE